MLQKLWKGHNGMKLPFLLSLSCRSKQTGDEADLPLDVSFAHPSDLISPFYCIASPHTLPESI